MFRLAPLILVLAASPIFAQARDVKVAGPTRLDWEFASAGFGAAAGKLPADFDSKQQKYQLYVPKGVDPKKPTSLLVFISPSDGPSGLGSWQKICEAEGMLFASPYKAGNSVPAGQRTRIVLDMVDDIRKNYQIDPDQTYISGFSGGGRMSCAIGFALPELFAGVLPVCGTNPIPGRTQQRQRIVERQAVAFITGEKDFNRKENEEYMFPWMQELGVKTKLWVAPKVAHAIPGADVMTEVMSWLKSDLKRRQEDTKARSKLAWAIGETPTPTEQAQRFVAQAESDLADPDRIWHGVALLQDTVVRWPKTQAGARAKGLLGKVVEDQKLLTIIDKQGLDDERKSLAAQAKALERFGLLTKAVEAWELLAKSQPNTPAAEEAMMHIRRLRALKK